MSARRSLAMVLTMVGTVLVLGAGEPRAGGKVDPNADLRRHLNHHSTLRQVLTVLELDGGAASWHVADVKLNALFEVGMKYDVPEATYTFVGAQQTLNCPGVSASSQTVSFNERVENTVTITKGSSFTAGIALSGEVPFTKIGVTTSASTTFTNDKAIGNSKSKEFVRSVSVPIEKDQGIVTRLEARAIVGDKIPWTATFEPHDQTKIHITLKSGGASSAGRACIDKDGGGQACFKAGDDDWIQTRNGKVHIKAPVKVTVWWHNFLTGRDQSRTIPGTKSETTDIGTPLKHIRVENFEVEKTVTFGQIKSTFPTEDDRRWTLNGTVSVSDFSDTVRFTNYVLDDKVFRRACGLSAAPLAKAPGASQTGAASSAREPMRRRLSLEQFEAMKGSLIEKH